MKQLIVLVLLAALVTACGGGKQVTRLDAETVTDLSGKWNDTDARLVAEEMVADALTHRWVTDYMEQHGERPFVTVGIIRNMTSEHINMEVFTTEFERQLINSGKVRFVQSKDARSELRAERQEQQEFATAETAKKMRAETGADFLLQGHVKTITDAEGGKSVVYYKTDFELVNIESMEKVWIGTKEIKKGISQGKTKW
jgi:hypothetical protein